MAKKSAHRRGLRTRKRKTRCTNQSAAEIWLKPSLCMWLRFWCELNENGTQFHGKIEKNTRTHIADNTTSWPIHTNTHAPMQSDPISNEPVNDNTLTRYDGVRHFDRRMRNKRQRTTIERNKLTTTAHRIQANIAQVHSGACNRDRNRKNTMHGPQREEETDQTANKLKQPKNDE